MEDPSNQQTIDEVLAKFEAIKDNLEALALKTKSLIEASLQDAGIRYQSVQARVKHRKKLQQKYLASEKDYKKLEDITDLVGCRVITYYEDDIDKAAEVIEREFEIDSQNSVDKRISEPDRFGYSAINFVCMHSAKRIADVEYKRFGKMLFEIQVTSILKHAWSEIEHEWYDLKETYPPNIKRDFSRLAAVFELVDSKFVDIREARTRYARSVQVRVEAMVPDVPIDAVSLKALLKQEPSVRQINQALADLAGLKLDPRTVSDRELTRAAKLLNDAGLNTTQQVSEALNTYKNAIPEYFRRCQNVWQPVSEGLTVKGYLAVVHLAVFEVCQRGLEETLRFFQENRILTNWDISAQVEIAKQVRSEVKR
jgi:GTP pyrophosphokinase